MKKVYLLFPFLALSLFGQSQMTIQSGATLFIESGAKVTIQGDLNSSANIQGSGTILMKGTGLQTINMNGNTIPNLEIDNSSNVTLSGSFARIGSSLVLTNGKLLTSGQDLYLSPTATISGHNSSRFIWTDGVGQVRKELTADISNYEIPVGFNTNYRPVLINSTGASYASANIGVRVLDNASSNRPPMMANFLHTAWPVTKTGITGGVQTITGQYNDPTDVSGSEATLSGYFFNGTDWTSVNETHDNASNRVAMPISAASGELTGMNKFITVGTRAYLQGAFTGSALMSDALRGDGAVTNVIPVLDPYRSAPYNTSFAHVSNPTAEMVSSSVFMNQASANDNIVDWVFLELRNTSSPGNTILQTRSALIQRDGDIVDVDGVSPVTFNNLTNGAYTIAVRHRNHIGLSTLPASPLSFSETKSTAFSTNIADLRLQSTALFGSAGTNYTTAVVGANTYNILWSGNVNANGASNYSGPNNDRLLLLTDLSGNQINTLSNGYYRGDLNMNRSVNYSGPGNDRLFLLSTVLGGNQIQTRSQALPN
jgi:hypothetical protein